jgi:hypothetical protein
LGGRSCQRDRTLAGALPEIAWKIQFRSSTSGYELNASVFKEEWPRQPLRLIEPVMF